MPVRAVSRKPPVIVKRKRSVWRRIAFAIMALVLGFYCLCGIALVALKWINPP